MTSRKFVKVVRDHGTDGWHQWIVLGDMVRRDAIGRLNSQGGHYRWLVAQCNNTECHARALVRTDVVEDLLPEAPNNPWAELKRDGDR